MAKTGYTRDNIVNNIKLLDVRVRNLTEEQIDAVIDMAYAELSIVSPELFSNEEIINLDEYYDTSEMKATFDVEEDATEIYDVYTTIEGEDTLKDTCTEVVQGIGICRNKDVAYLDNRYVGRFHIDLGAESALDTVYDNLIAKYYFTPSATTEIVYMSKQVFRSFQDAIGIAVNYFVKDIEGEAQKRASLLRTSSGIQNAPEDIPDMPQSIFGGLYYGN